MDEEQAVLDFFAKPENLPLGLSVALQMDEIRCQMNSRFWQDFQQRLNTTLQGTEWQTQVTEDRNAADVRVGLQCKLHKPQELCLFPMMEQQYTGGDWRIFMGLMWQRPPAPEQLALAAVSALKQSLTDAGFGHNENFLAWKWTHFHPRRRDFLLRYAQQPEKLINEVESTFDSLLGAHRELIAAANAALKTAPRSMPISLNQLHRKREN
ncbi:MAG: hypothetical protein PHP85_06315 [Gallionella sp.]|nr:hypothetical protein [Gallionella sp.]